MRQAMTATELRLWLRLRNRGLEGYRFRRQAPLGPYIVDFFCAERKLVVEVDGDEHGFDAVKMRDAIRSRWIERQGHRILRVSNRDVMFNLDGVCAAIVSLCRRPMS
jgi:very-short-patch-repair endonuclease